MKSHRGHETYLSLLLAVSILAGWHALREPLVLAARDDQYTHILLILPVGLAMILPHWRTLRAMATLNFRAGVAVLSVALLIAGLSVGWSTRIPGDVLLSIRTFALVLWWIGSFVLCFGYRCARSVLFPLLFLFGLVPHPQSALNAVVVLLQQGSAWTASLFFLACGVPVSQDGVIVTIPGLTVVVAEECSSIRSSSMLLVTTIVLAYFLLRSRWRRAVVIGLALPLSVAKNGLRVFSIAMLATRVDPAYLTGRLHHQGGIVFFAIAVFAMLGVFVILRRGENRLLRSVPIPAKSDDSDGQSEAPPAPTES